MGNFYIVASPIGNLDDISKRAVETLSSVDLILAEDTRVTQKLLNHFDINKDILSYHQHSGEEKKLEILNLLLNGKNVALVSDAGTPGIADPGNELVEFIYANSSLPSSKFLEAPASPRISAVGEPSFIQIIPIPGPSAVSTALSVCGFNVSQYLFLGFWPKKKHSKIIKTIQSIQSPVVFFESPHRIVKTLEKLFELGERRVFVGRELTKLHETHYRGTLGEVLNRLKSEKFLKGEIVVVVE